jgi:hypothetical protein
VDTLDFSISVSAQNNFISLQLFRNGAQVAWVNPGTNNYTWTPRDKPPMGENYYFVRAQQVDGDYMWSSPVWVTSTSGGWTLISQVNADNANGEPLMLGQQVTIKGLATVATGTLSTVDNDIFMQDATGGVNVYKRTTQIPAVAVGDSLSVTGFVDQYNGLTRITSPTITVVTPGAGSTVPRLLTTNEIAATGETYEGSLVTVHGCLITGGTWPGAGSDGSVTIDDGTGGCTMFIDKDTNIDGTAQPDGRIDVVGVLTQYDNSLPYTSGYRIVPRSTADITTAPGAGVPPVAAGDLFRLAPNPARGQVRVDLGGAVQSPVVVRFYSASGRLLDEVAPAAGADHIDWRGVDSRGNALPGGIYFVVVRSGSRQETAKVIFVR